MTDLGSSWSPWFSTIVASIGVLAVLVVLGTGLARAVGLRGWDALLLSPALGTGLLLCAGAALGRMGWAWTWWGGGLTVLVLSVLAGGLAVLVAGTTSHIRVARDLSPQTHGSGATLMLPLGLFAAATLVTATLTSAIPSPGSVAPGPDTIFHLGSAVWQVDHASADALSVGDFPWTNPAPYPGGYQALLATIVGWTSIPVTNGSLIILIVLAGYVLPWGSAVLARTAFGDRPLALLSVPVVVVSIPVLTYEQLATGPTWSNLMSMALVPSLLAVCLAASSLSDSRQRVLPRLAVLALILATSVAITQPSGLFVAAVLVVLMMVSSPSSFLKILGVVAAALLVAVWALLAPARMTEVDVSGPTLIREGVLIALKADYGPGQWRSALFVLLLLVGLGASIRRRHTAWICVGWAFLALLWLSPAVVSGGVLPGVLWPWWNSSHRILAALAIPATLLVVHGTLATERLLLQSVRGGAAASNVVRLSVALAVLGWAASSAASNARLVRAAYEPPSDDSLWVTPSELEALSTLGDQVEPGSVVAANPFRGGSYMYITSDTLMLFPTEKAFDAIGPAVLAAKLVDLGTDSEACRWADDLDVHYALTGGEAPPGNERADRTFPGIDDISEEAAGFHIVGAAGGYTLYRVPDCATD